VLEAALISSVASVTGWCRSDARREEDDQPVRALLMLFRAERGSQYGNAVQQGNAAGALRVGFLYEAADGYRIAVLHRDLVLKRPVLEGRRLNAVEEGAIGELTCWVDHHRDHAARIHRAVMESVTPVLTLFTVLANGSCHRRDAADNRLRGEHGDGTAPRSSWPERCRWR